ncbi:MAG: hypothetical protein ACR2NZ_05525 [Rubripirellula sp.]
MTISSCDGVDVDALVGCDVRGNVWIDQRVAFQLLRWLQLGPPVDCCEPQVINPPGY